MAPPPHSLRSYPLRYHLSLLLLCAVVPLIVLTFIIILHYVSMERDATIALLERSADVLSREMDREMMISIHALDTLAQSETLQRDDRKAFYEEARRVVGVQPGWRQIILLSEGKQILNTNFEFGTALPAVVDPESLQQTTQSGQPTVGNFVAGASGVFAFPVRVPVPRKGASPYILSAVVLPQTIQALLSATPLQTSEWTRVVVDGRGTIVARTRSSEQFVGTSASDFFLTQWKSAKRGLFKRVSRDGQPSYVAYTTSTLTGWASMVLVPTQTIDGPIKALFLQLILVSLLVIVISVAGAYLLSRAVSRSLNSATKAAETISAGKTATFASSSVSEFVRLGDALVRTSELLEQREVALKESLAQALEARSAAESANAEKDKFIAMLGHELRNPLAPIKSSAQLLKMLHQEDNKIISVADVIERQADHMTRIVSDLLDTSRIQQGKLCIESRVINLGEITHNVLTDYEAGLTQAGVRLVKNIADEPLYVTGDSTRLAQCLGNLLHNAQKFTPAGGRVTVTLARANNFAELTVQDEGVGIAQELIKQLFEPFAQGAQSLARTQGGLGLGLALVRRLIELHHGTVEAKSDGPGQGASFIMRIPLTQQRELPIARHESSAPPAPALRIVVIEDNLDSAKLLQRVLTLSGHQVEIAYNGRSGIQLAQNLSPDVVICDLGLPDIDGYTVARQLRASAQGNQLKLIALTGYGQSRDIEEALASGFNLHFTKPVDIRRLQSSLRELTSSSTANSASRPIA